MLRLASTYAASFCAFKSWEYAFSAANLKKKKSVEKNKTQAARSNVLLRSFIKNSKLNDSPVFSNVNSKILLKIF